MTAELSLILTQSLRRMGLAEAYEEPRFTALQGGVSSEIWRADLRRGAVCVKRALPKLQTAAEWYVPVERNRYEIAWLRIAGGIIPDAAPKVLGVDAAQGLFAMEHLPPETYKLWRSELRDGHADPSVASAAGTLLVRMHSGTAGREEIAAQFPSDAIFHAIRLAPYFEETARKHPALAARLHALAEITAASKYVLIHGDVSPKNILIGPAGPVFLDAECAWYGDPAFDLAFCLNHLLLKCLWRPVFAGLFLSCFGALRASYLPGVTWESQAGLEARASRLLPALLLGRIDGKSPVDYITAEQPRNLVRRVAGSLIERQPSRLLDIAGTWAEELRIA